MTTSDAETGTMHIGELAEKTGLSLRTIRHYDGFPAQAVERRAKLQQQLELADEFLDLLRHR